MSTEVAVKINYFIPQNFVEAERFAEKIANSSLCPTSFQKKPGDVLIAMQMGAEVGLSPMQALQNIAVINGRPCLWGDGALAVVRVHPKCKSIREWTEGSIEKGDLITFCGVTRAGQEEEVRSFSIVQAKKAGLCNRQQGPWVSYPERMLQMRARGFAIRDTFADALRGLSVAEEVMDYVVDVTPEKKEKPPQLTASRPVITAPISQNNEINQEELDKHIDIIRISEDMEVLKSVYKIAMNEFKYSREAMSQIVLVKDEKKKELDNTFFQKKPDPESAIVVNEFLQEYDSAGA